MSASYSALFQETVANPNIRAYLSHANMDCKTKDSIRLIGGRETKQASKQASSYFLQSRKATGYQDSIWANLSRHTDT